MKKTKARRDLDEYIYIYILCIPLIFPIWSKRFIYLCYRIFFFFFLNNVRFFLSCIFTRASKSSGFSVHPHLEFYTSSREYFSQSQSRSFASFFLFRNAHSFLRFIVPINSSFRHKLTHLHLDFLFLVIIIESEALFYFLFFSRTEMTWLWRRYLWREKFINTWIIVTYWIMYLMLLLFEIFQI